jgi:hypothetical protein
MWRWYGTKAWGKDDLTPRQLVLSARVREVLTAERVKFEEGIWVLGLLLRNDVRIRECRTIFGGTVRAIGLATGKDEGGWNGERPAVRRRECPEQVFSNWYQRSDSP